MTASKADGIVVKITLGLDAVLAAEARERQSIFANVHMVVLNWLDALEGEARTETSGFDDFVRMSRIYLRALKTYHADQSEWLDVFYAFRLHFDRWASENYSEVSLSPMAMETEIDRLRKNSHLILKE